MLTRFRTWFIETSLKGDRKSAKQEHLDIYRTAMVLHYREYLRGKGHDLRLPPPKDLVEAGAEAMVTEAGKMDHVERMQFVRDRIQEQVVHLLRTVQSVGDTLDQAAEEREKQRQLNRENQTQDFSTQFALDQGVHGEKAALLRQTALDKIKEDVGYSLSVKKSTIPGAGKGVFIDGRAAPGTVMAFFPGQVYLPEHLTRQHEVDALFRRGENDLVMARYDRAIIDAEPVGIYPFNPFGLGHVINHPAINGRPTVLGVAYDVPSSTESGEEFPQDLKDLVPNRFVKPPILRLIDNIHMKTIVFVSMEELVNCEIFVNYRFNPNLETPAWYHHVNIEEDRQRWQ